MLQTHHDQGLLLNVQHNLQNNGKWMVGDPITIKGIFDNIEFEIVKKRNDYE